MSEYEVMSWGDAGEAMAALTQLAEHLAGYGKSALIVLSDTEGCVVGVALRREDAEALPKQMRVLADDIEARVRAESN